MARVIVTGGSGLVGKGVEWVVENKPSVIGDAKFIFLSSKDADLRDEAQTLECFKRLQPTHVIHLAARVVRLSSYREGDLHTIYQSRTFTPAFADQRSSFISSSLSL
jgi:hypothetical protein